MSQLHRIWDLGQQHLVAGRYQAARRELELAESIAWREGDAASLARLYLSLLEARRQIRYQAAEGRIWIGGWRDSPGSVRRAVQSVLEAEAGTCLIAAGAGGHLGNPVGHAMGLAGQVQHAARRSGRALEALVLVKHGTEVRICTPVHPTFADAIPVLEVHDSPPTLGESTDPGLTIPLPAAGSYEGSQAGAGAMARESIILAWEALALKWQHRHPPPRTRDPWDEMAWLRLALRVDGACEPIIMRLIALAEATERSG